MKKLLAILLSLVMIAGLLACNGTKPETPATDGGKVEITGVHDMTVEAGHEIDVLEGVSAGDLTSMITIESSPTLDFKGGKATPETAGNYELVYSVTDKSGATVAAYATRTVTKKTGEAVLLKDFDFSTL